MDIGLAALGLFASAPVLAVVAYRVRRELGRPVLFRQERPGLGGKNFSIVKFRTMRDERDTSGRLLPDEIRITPFGAFLRQTSLDELPELWNVLLGDMSLVGPRPLLERYLPFYTGRERIRFCVRPGMTGCAQLAGRNLLPWGQRLELDAWYVENRSLRLDIVLLVRTVAATVRRTGVVPVPDTVMEDLDVIRGAASYEN